MLLTLPLQLCVFRKLCEAFLPVDCLGHPQTHVLTNFDQIQNHNGQLTAAAATGVAGAGTGVCVMLLSCVFMSWWSPVYWTQGNGGSTAAGGQGHTG